MKLSLSSLVLLVILGVAISQQIQRDYVPEVVYPNKANRLRSRVNTGSVEQKQTSARRNQLDDRQHNLLQKRLEHIKENRRNRDQFIVVAPVEGHRVYTKDRYSVSQNGLLKGGPASQRPSVRVQSGKLGKSEVKEVGHQSSVHRDQFLKLVTVVPPLSTTRRIESSSRRDQSYNITQGVRVSGQTDRISLPSNKLRFPAQPWQIPPNLSSKLDRRPLLQSSSFSSEERELKSFELLGSHKRPLPLSKDQYLDRVPAPSEPSPASSYRSAELTPEPQSIKPPYRSNQNSQALSSYHYDLKPKATFAKTDAREPIPLPSSSNGFHVSSSNEDFPLAPSSILASDNSIGLNPIVPSNMLKRPVSSLLNPNQKLDLCCRKQGVSPVCQTMCNFDTFSDKSLVNAFLTNQCPGNQLGQAFDCATTKADHSECCIRKNVHAFNNGQCLPFCRTHVPTPPNAFEYLACLQVFESIKGCYREYQTSNPNLFGD